MKNNTRFLLFTLALVVLTTACKFFLGPVLDWSGFSPVIAIALFAGMIVKQKDFSFLLPLLALFLSDAAIELLYRTGNFEYAGFYGGQWKNYLLLLGCTFIGWMVKGRNYGSLLTGAVAAPTVYFLVSNFMVWQATTEAIYPKTFGGLMTCYDMALPFYRNSLLATLVFLPLILGAYNYFLNRKAAIRLA